MEKKNLLLLVASVLLSAGGYLILRSHLPDLYYSWIRFGKGLFWGGGALAVVFVGLLFVPRAWATWWKFASWFVPLTALLFVFYPEPGSGDLFSPYPETVYQWMSGLYIGVSIVIIAISYMQKGPQNPS